MGLTNKKLRKQVDGIGTNKANDDSIDVNSLSEEEKSQLNDSKAVAFENTDTSLTIDGVTINATSVQVENDLNLINSNVDNDLNDISVFNSEISKRENGAEQVKIGALSLILLIFMFLI